MEADEDDKRPNMPENEGHQEDVEEQVEVELGEEVV